jgi:hypothetical protein
MFAYQDDDEPGHCFSCGGPAPWLVLIGGEDEPPHQEWACELHARGHRRLALVTPPSVDVALAQHQVYWRT